ncbi:hypothetical protein D3C72_409580 [compost metagenome]
MGRVVGQVFFDLVADAVGKVDEVTVEVLAALQFETPQRRVQQHLFQADRVGHRDQDDLALQAALLFQFAEATLEVPGHQHAGQLVGMQRSLDIDLATTAGAEVETVQLARDARNGGKQVVG